MMYDEKRVSNSELAEASYANLWDSLSGKPITDDETIKLRLASKDIGNEQANFILTKWSVASYQRNTATDNMSVSARRLTV